MKVVVSAKVVRVMKMKRMKVAAMQDFGLIITSRLLIWVKEEGKSSLTSWLLVVLPFLK